jgi:uncharacterized membrane protein YdjX (TVP38/TMEM64 family)
MPHSASRRRSRPSHRAPGKSEKKGGGIRLPWARLVVPLIGLIAVAVVLSRPSYLAAVHRTAAQLNGGVAFALLTVLPLVGFPASVLHVAAGIRFGVTLGLALVSLSILLQLLASYALVHVWRRRFSEAQWLRRIRERIPQGAHASVCVFALLLPGAPFTAINYTLPLIGVPLRTYLLCCLPLHTLRATITVGFGGETNQLTPARLALLAGYALLLMSASWWTYRRLRWRFASPP